MSGGPRSPGAAGRTDTGRVPGAAKAATALAPARAYLLRAARTEANQIRAAARAEADQLLSRARQDAERAVRDGAARGRAEAAPLAAAERSRGRSAAQSIVLGAQREAYDELRRRICQLTDGLRADPGYGLLLERLTAVAAAAAGPDATVTASPDGGVLARSGQVMVDCSLPKLAGEAADALGDRVRKLWQP
jgi:vacuolar-type H+-ATPase subunit E/Vma4